VIAFLAAQTLIRFSTLGAGKTVRESDMGNLDDLPVLLGCQLAAPFHQMLGRTIGRTAVFWILAGMCIVAALFIYFRVPETRGRSLEQIELDLRDRMKVGS
jgi:hypothetical protein